MAESAQQLQHLVDTFKKGISEHESDSRRYRNVPEIRKAFRDDLDSDISETIDLSKRHTDILAKMKSFAKASHEPVRPGTFADPKRTLHERDRWAKWGTSGEDPRKK